MAIKTSTIIFVLSFTLLFIAADVGVVQGHNCACTKSYPNPMACRNQCGGHCRHIRCGNGHCHGRECCCER